MEKSKNYILYVQIILIFCWLSFLADSDSYFMPYLAVGIVGIFCVYSNYHSNVLFHKNRENIIAAVLAMIFGVIVLMANYLMFADSIFESKQEKTIRLVYLIALFFGGSSSMWHILRFLSGKNYVPSKSTEVHGRKMDIVFTGSLAVISAMNLIFMFFTGYPGNLSPDSLNQISQILSGTYSNHHPFYHTMVIRLFLSIGLQLFGDINMAVALYSIFQIFFMAACFSFTVLTLYQMGISKKTVIMVLLWYTLMPFHIMYSFTMWKDVLFGGMVILFLTSVFRIQKKIGKCLCINYLLMITGGTGVCLLRSNGWFVFVVSAICFVVLFKKRYKRICLIFAAILAVTFLLKHTVLEILEVNQPDTIEALSIPAQQIARVIADNGKLTNEQFEMLEQIVDVIQVKEQYNRGISDPVKYLIRDKGNQNYLSENMAEYLKLYISIGTANPGEYIKAWIDETKGYWNGGYPCWWQDKVDENQLGIFQTVRSDSLRSVLDSYRWLCSSVVPFQILMCIGFHVWLIVILGYICLVRGNKEGFFLCVPNLAIILSLIISTPVFSEFRYSYAIFCCIPLLLFTTFCKNIQITE